MRTFRKDLKERLKDDRFRRLYEEEKQLADLALKIYGARQRRGLSQKEVAEMAKITQQQLSKLENGINCNVTTFLKVCSALDLKVDVEDSRSTRTAAQAL